MAKTKPQAWWRREPPPDEPPVDWQHGPEARRYLYRRDHETRVEHAQRCANGEQYADHRGLARWR
jgi:hypothetical protein